MQTLYSTLEVSPDATEQEIRKAYLRLSVKHHPDKNPGKKEESEARCAHWIDTPRNRQAKCLALRSFGVFTLIEEFECIRRFIEIAAAYEVLSDPEKRRAYDLEIRHGPSRPNTGRGDGTTEDAWRSGGSFSQRALTRPWLAGLDPHRPTRTPQDEEKLRRAHNLFQSFVDGLAAANGVAVVRGSRSGGAQGMAASLATTTAGMTAARVAGNRGHNAVVRTVVAMAAQEMVKVHSPVPI
eukprot:5988684-Pyramimonas_sp.AAC.2